MKLSKLSELKRTMGQMVHDLNEGNFPKTINFSRGIEFPKFKITVELVEEDYFVDSKGQKWAKIREEQ